MEGNNKSIEEEKSEEEKVEQEVVNENLRCRLYRKDFPEETDLVIVIILDLLIMSMFRLR